MRGPLFWQSCYFVHFIKVDLYGASNVVSGIITQGAPFNSQWVKTYKVRTGLQDCDMQYILGDSDQPMVCNPKASACFHRRHAFWSSIFCEYGNTEQPDRSRWFDPWPYSIHVTWLSKSRLIFMRIDDLKISSIYYISDVSLSKLLKDTIKNM